ncbi:MAG: hypothetical protein FWC02_00615 [Firmicutes bacterium]|nr:hypothetical protein [Bacillota bacterium]
MVANRNEIQVGLPIHQYGQRSGRRTGTITATNANSNVGPFADGSVRPFHDQIRHNGGANPGDSGSPVFIISGNRRILAATTFAGGNTSALASKITNIISTLNVTIRTNINPLPTPTGVQVNQNTRVVSWSAVANAQGYHIYLSGRRATRTPTTALNFNLNTLPAYVGGNRVQVRAVSMAVGRTDSALSASVNLTNPVVGVLTTPTWRQSGTITNGFFRVFNIDERSTGIHVYAGNIRVYTSNSIDRREGVETARIESTRFQTPFPAGWSNLRIRTVSSATYLNDSELSDAHWVIHAGTLSLPINISVNQSNGVISWTRPVGADQFRVHVYVAGVRRTTQYQFTSFNLTTLGLPLGQHNIQLRSYNHRRSEAAFANINNSGLTVAVTFISSMTLATPTNIQADRTTGLVTWGAVQFATGYHVYVDNVRRTTTPVTGTSFNLNTISGLAVGQHLVRVRAVSTAIYRNDSNWSAQVWGAVTMTLATPTGVSINQSTGVVSWNVVANATSYRVYVGGVFRANATPTNFNLTTISLGAGVHSIQIRAISTAIYRLDSGLSAGQNFTRVGEWSNNGWTNGTQISNHHYNAIAGYRIGRASSTNEPHFTAPFSEWNFNHFGAGNANSSPLTMWIRDPIQPGTEFHVNASSFMTPRNTFDHVVFTRHAEQWPRSAQGSGGGISSPGTGWNLGDYWILHTIRIVVPENARRHGLMYKRLNLQLRHNYAPNRHLFESQVVYIIFRLPDSRTPLSAPNVTVNANAETISWANNVNALGFHVYIEGQRRTTSLVTSNSTSLAPFNLGIGVHNIQVRALSNNVAFLDSALSVNRVFTRYMTLATPTGVNINQTLGVVSWGAVPYVNGYHIYANGTRRTTTMVSGTSFNLGTIGLSEALYGIQIRAVANAVYRLDSALSDSQDFATISEVQTPSNIRLGMHNEWSIFVTVLWDAVFGATNFHVYVEGEHLVTLGGNVTSFNINTLRSELLLGYHSIQVRAVHSSPLIQNSGLSESVNAFLRVSLDEFYFEFDEENLMLTWDYVPHATNFRFYLWDVDWNEFHYFDVGAVLSFDFRVVRELLDLGSFYLELMAMSTSIYHAHRWSENWERIRITMALLVPNGLLLDQSTSILTWNETERATGYHVYSGSERITSQAVLVNFVDLNTLGLRAGFHNIHIRATSDEIYVNDSPLSQSVVFMSVHILSQPVNVVFSEPMLSFSSSAYATGFHIYANGVRATTMPMGANSINIAYLNLQVGILSIQVRAVNAAIYWLDSPLSNAIIVTVHATLGTPQNISINQSNGLLTFSSVVNATGYYVYVNGVRATTEPIFGTVINVNILNLRVGHNQIQARATSSAMYFWDSPLSATVTFVRVITLTAPVATINQTTGYMVWDEVDYAAGYHIYVGGIRRTSTILTTNIINLNNLPIPLGYQLVQIVAMGNVFYVNNSPRSAPLNFTVETTLSRPVVTVNERTRVISWTNVQHAARYEVHLNGELFATVATFQVNMGQLPLSNGVNYVQVRAINPASYIHDSQLSEKGEFVIGLTLFAPNITVNGNIVSWNPVPYAEGYFVYINGVRRNSEMISATSIDLVAMFSLTFGVHNIQVRATASAIYLFDSVLSATRQLTLGTVLSAPTNLSFNETSGILQWAGVMNATRYQVFVNGIFRVQTTDTFVSIDSLNLISGEHSITIRALADRPDMLTSAPSLSFIKSVARALTAPVINEIENGREVITWNRVEGAIGFAIYVNGVLNQRLPATAREVTFARLGLNGNGNGNGGNNNGNGSEGASEYLIQIRALGASGQSVDSALSEVQVVRIIPPTVDIDDGFEWTWWWILIIVGGVFFLIIIAVVIIFLVLVLKKNKSPRKHKQAKNKKSLNGNYTAHYPQQGYGQQGYYGYPHIHNGQGYYGQQSHYSHPQGHYQQAYYYGRHPQQMQQAYYGQHQRPYTHVSPQKQLPYKGNSQKPLALTQGTGQNYGNKPNPNKNGQQRNNQQRKLSSSKQAAQKQYVQLYDGNIRHISNQAPPRNNPYAHTYAPPTQHHHHQKTSHNKPPRR